MTGDHQYYMVVVELAAHCVRRHRQEGLDPRDSIDEELVRNVCERFGKNVEEDVLDELKNGWGRSALIEEALADDSGASEALFSQVILKYQLTDAPVDSNTRRGPGQVIRAEDLNLLRQVILKSPRSASSPDAPFRFEALITSEMDHPGVLPVYSSGRHRDGRPFFSMKVATEGTLEERIRDDWKKGFPADSRLRSLLDRFLKVCDTVNYAHGKGIAHLDVKPANILLDEDGQTYLADFGNAIRFKRRKPVADGETPSYETTTANDESEQVGRKDLRATPMYESPEQAKHRLNLMEKPDLFDAELVSLIGPRADIYGLGATLFQILTGEPPFKADSDQELTTQVSGGIHGTRREPRRLWPELCPALEAICLMAMAPRTTDRYDNAREISLDVRRWLNGEKVKAPYKPPLRHRVDRWISAHRRTFSWSVALFAVIVCVTAGYFIRRFESHKRDLVLEAERREREQERLEDHREHREGMLRSTASFQFDSFGEHLKLLRADVKYLAAIEGTRKALINYKANRLSVLKPKSVAPQGCKGEEPTPQQQLLDLTNRYKQLLKPRTEYFQARLIGFDGQELIRAHRTENKDGKDDIDTVEQLELADPKNGYYRPGRGYFKDSQEPPFGKVRLSEIDLNSERGIRQIANPVIRATLALHDSDKNFLGIVVINRWFHDLAGVRKRETRDGPLETFLAKRTGEWVMHPVGPIAFGKQRGLKEFSCYKEFPEIDRLKYEFEDDDNKEFFRNVERKAPIHIALKPADGFDVNEEAVAKAISDLKGKLSALRLVHLEIDVKPTESATHEKSDAKYPEAIVWGARSGDVEEIRLALAKPDSKPSPTDKDAARPWNEIRQPAWLPKWDLTISYTNLSASYMVSVRRIELRPGRNVLLIVIAPYF